MTNDFREQILQQYDVEEHITVSLWELTFQPNDTGMLQAFFGDNEDILVEADIKGSLLTIHVTSMTRSPKQTVSMDIECLPIVRAQRMGEEHRGAVLLSKTDIVVFVQRTIWLLAGA